MVRLEHNVMSSNAETSRTSQGGISRFLRYIPLSRDSLPDCVVQAGGRNDGWGKLESLCVLCVISLCPLWLSVNESYAQIDSFANVKLNRTTVYPEQPIKATVTVYTATWFTKPLDFDNIQVPNSFVIPFKRTLSTMHEVRGKKYASLEFYYLIYPYESGQYQMPSIEIRIETPPQGDYKGQPTTVRTNAVEFTVSEVPPEFEGKTWFVAKNVRLSQSWDRPLSDLKVGDVIERTVTIRAAGTMPNFIPEITFTSEEFGSAYPKTGSLNDRRDEKDVNGTRIEKVVYLLEKEGDFEISGVRIEWWNPYSQQLLFRELEAIPITVVDNPNLGMIRTLKDSLALTSGAMETAKAEDAPFMILGMKPWKFFAALVLLMVVVRFIVRVLIESTKKAKKRKRDWMNSEKYSFKEIFSNKNAGSNEILNLVYVWWDRFRLAYGFSSSMRETMLKSESDRLLVFWQEIESSQFSSSNPGSVSPEFFNLLKDYRKRLLEAQALDPGKISEIQTAWN